MIELWLLGVNAWLAGLAGSGHCVSMCGGIASMASLDHRPVPAQSGATAVALPGSRTAASPVWRSVLLFNGGRLTSYAAAGMLVALVAGLLQWPILDQPKLGVWLRALTGVVLLLIALQLMRSSFRLAWLDRLGARFFAQLRPLASRWMGDPRGSARFALGMIWGWLPCGLVYSMLLLAASTGSARTGAVVMLGFGLGTLPSMLASGILARWLSQQRQHAASRRVLAGLVALSAVIMIASPWMQPMGHEHMHHP